MLQVIRNSNENVERLGLSQDGSGDVKCRDRDIFFYCICNLIWFSVKGANSQSCEEMKFGTWELFLC